MNIRRHALHLSLLLLAWIVAGLAGPAARAAILPVPAGPVIGDGTTATRVLLYLPDYQAGDRIKVKPHRGRAGSVEVSPDGIVAFEWFAPRVTAPQSQGITVIRKGTFKEKAELSFEVVPGFGGSLEIGFDPETVRVGSGSALVRITPGSSTPQANEARQFRLSASIGTVTEPAPAGDGTWIARYTPPSSLSGPQAAILTAVDTAAPDRIQGWASLPVLVEHAVTVTAPPEANTLLHVGDATYGPLKASAQGTVVFQVQGHPAHAEGRVEAVGADGQQTTSTVDLPHPEQAQVHFLPLPPSMPADPEGEWPVRMVAVDAAGHPLRDASLVLRASAGQVSVVRETGRLGVYEARFTPPTEPGVVTFTAGVQEMEATASLELVRPRPRVDLTADPKVLPEGERYFTLQARVKDARGAGLPEHPPHLVVEGARIRGRLKDNGDGTYSARYRIDSDAVQVRASAVPPGPTSAWNAHRLLLWTDRVAVPADGVTRVPVVVLALDALGLPVPGVRVTLAVPQGDAAVHPDHVTDDFGLVRANLVAGRNPGLASVRAEAAGLAVATPVLQLGPEHSAPDIGLSGTEAHRELLQQWRAAIPTLVVRREGSAPEVGPPATVRVTTTPPYTTPGAALLVTLQVLDAKGNPVPGAEPEVEASLGKVGVLTDNGNGSYNVPIQLPAGQDGPITVKVEAGDARNSLVVARYADTAAATAAAPARSAARAGSAGTGGTGQTRERRSTGVPGETTAPVSSSESTAAVEAPSSASTTPQGRARVRVHGGFGLLGHVYEMENQTEAAAPEGASFVNGNFFGGPLGGAPALQGAALVHAWDFPLVLTADVLAWREELDVALDTVKQSGATLHVGARYRADLGGGLYAYGGVGYLRTSSFGFVFTTEEQNETEIEAFHGGGVRLTAGAGVETGHFWAELEGGGTFSPSPAMGGVRSTFAMDVSPNLYTYLSFDATWRRLRFEEPSTDEEIEVRDSLQPLVVGIGGVVR